MELDMHELDIVLSELRSQLADAFSLTPRRRTYEELRRALPQVVEHVAELQAEGVLEADDAGELIRLFAVKVFEAHINENLSGIASGFTNVGQHLPSRFNYFNRVISYE